MAKLFECCNLGERLGTPTPLASGCVLEQDTGVLVPRL